MFFNFFIYLFFYLFSIYFLIIFLFIFFYLFKLKFMVNGHQTFAHHHAYICMIEVNVVHQRPDGVLEKTKRFLLL